MTQPGGAEVGTAYVSVIPSARGFAKKLQAEMAREFRSANLDELVQQAFGRTAITVPVRPDFEQGTLTAHVDVEVDGATEALRDAVRRAEHAVDAHVEVDVDVDKDSTRGIGALGSALSRVVPDGLLSKLNGIGSAMQDVIGQGVRMGGTVAGALTTAAGPVGAVVAGLAGVAAALGGIAAAATFGIPAVTALAGAIAAIPAAIAGAGAAFGALSLGFKGISDAFKPKTGGGGGGGAGEDPASRARRIAAAERGVAAARRGIEAATRGVAAAQRGLADAERNLGDAQRRSRDAQVAVNRARKEAAEDLEDLDRQLRGAQLDEQDAALRVTEALRELNEAKESGNLPDIQRANLEYEQAKLNLENAKDATEDLGEASAEANKKGIDGSDKVQQALQDQRDAADAVRDAQNGILDAQDALTSANDSLKASYDGLASATDSLAEAQKKVSTGGGGGGVASLVKLAPNAQKFVNAIKRLKPAFDDLRLDVQNKLFKDLDQTVTHLADAWLEPLKTTLGNYATTFNEFFRDLGKNISKPKFIDDIQTGAEGARKGLEAIGKAISGPLVEAFGALSKAGGPFLEALGNEIADVVTQFSNWVLAGERSGALQTFFTNAAEAMHQIFDIGGNVAKIIGNLIEIISGKKIGTGKTPLESFNGALEDLNGWLDDPQNQEKVRELFGAIVDGARDVIDIIKLAEPFVAKIGDWISDFNDLRKGISDALSGDNANSIGAALVSGILAGIGATIKANVASLAEFAQFIIDKIKQLFGIKSPSTVMATIGGYLVDGLIKGIGDKFTALVRKAAQLPAQIRAGITNATRILYAHGQNVVIGLINGIGSYLRSLSTRAGMLKTTITNKVVNAGSWLYSAGRNVVIGLYDGIASLGSWLARKVAAFIAAYVPAPIRSALGIASPSKVAAELGKQVPAGLAVGIESGSGLVESAARSMADAALPTLGPVTNPAAGLGTGATGGAAIELYWRAGARGDKVLDGLRDIIAASYRGDPVAALSRR